MASSVVISGIGQTEYSKQSGRSEVRLGMEAILNACADAQLDPREIDGIVSYKHNIGAEDVFANLGLNALRWSATLQMGGASAVGSLRLAADAIRLGEARHVVVVRARNGFSGARVHDRPSQLPSQQFRTSLETPYGWNSSSQRYAMIARRYMHEHDLSREQLGAVAVTMRAHAQLNPNAQMYGRELTLEQYLAGRMISDPYTLYDCSLETDGGCAVIISANDRSYGRDTEAGILAVGEGHPESPDDLSNRSDLLRIGLDEAAPIAWNEAGLGPEDMDAAMIYDCFTFELLHQLEAAGFTAAGTSGAFVAAGNISLGGRLPVNTSGGLLSEGHLSGLSHVIEAVRQLRGECGSRQIEGVRHIAVTGWGDLGDGTLAVMGKLRSRS